jgi:hypothetical protein
MSTAERTTSRQINVPDDSDGTHIATEYGCRFPDGHQEWGTFVSNGGINHGYANIIPTSGEVYSAGSANEWRLRLERKAKEASIHPADFIENHTFIKRTIILVTTAAEEL